MHLALGYLAYEINHKDYYVLALLSIILGRKYVQPFI